MRKIISALLTATIFISLLMPCVQADLIDASELHDSLDSSNIFTEDFNDSFSTILTENVTRGIDNRGHYSSYIHSTADGGMTFTMSGGKIDFKTTKVNTNGVMFFNRDMLYDNDMTKDYEISMKAKRNANNDTGTGSINENIGMRLRSHGEYNKNFYEAGICTSYLVPAGYSPTLYDNPDHPYIVKFNDTDTNLSKGCVYTYIFKDVPRLAPYETFDVTSGIVSGKLPDGTLYDKIYMEGKFVNRANSNTSGTREISADGYIAGGKYSWESFTENNKLYVRFSGYIIDTHPFTEAAATDTAAFTTGISLISQGNTASATSNGQVEIYDLKLNALRAPYEEPESLIYNNIAYGKAFDSNGIMELDDETIIRRITVATPADIYAKTKNASEYKLYCSASSFTDNTWVNTLNNDKIKYIKVDTAQEIKLYQETDKDNPINFFMGESKEFLPKINGSFDNIEASAASPAVTVNGGVVTGVTKGSGAVVFSLDGTDLSLNINVLGELEYAENMGIVPEYVADKTPILNSINTALAGGDTDSLYNTVFGEGDDTLENLIDFDRSGIMGLSVENKEKYIARLATYALFGGDNITLDNIKQLITALQNEELVSELSASPTSLAAGEFIEENNDVFGCNLDAEDFVKYKSQTYDILRTANIKNAADVKTQFINSYILAAFYANLSSGGVIAILEKYEDEIGYDNDNYGEISDKEDLGYALLSQKTNIGTIGALKAAVDGYIPTNNGGGSGGNSGGNKVSGNMGGGSGGVSTVKTDLPSVSVKEEASLFSDITVDHWAYESIKQLFALNIINGYLDGTVGADNNVTRAEFVKMLVAAFGYTVPEENAIENFEDVKEDDWYYNAMLAARVNNIVMGSDNNCNPDAQITREEMAVLIFRVIQNKGIKAEAVNAPIEFDDASDISEWAYLSVMQLYKMDVVKGVSDTEFGAKQLATRAQAAKMIGSVLNMTEEVK